MAPRERDPDRREQQKAERRQALLDGAVEAIRAHGPAVSMEELAAAAAVTKPILYRHFGDRAGIVVALADRFAAALLSDLQKALAAPATDPQATLVAAIDAFLTFLENDPEIYRFLVRQASQGGITEAHRTLDTFIDRVSQEVAVVVGESLAAAGRDSGGAEPLAHGIVGFVYGAGDWWIERRSMSRARLVQYLASTLWSGFSGMGLGGATTVEPVAVTVNGKDR